MIFYLGTHIPSWLGRSEVPLFVSRTRLIGRKNLPRAKGRWALDSGGFSELQYRGRWTTTPAEYVAFVRRCVDEIGNLDWAAPMDWMCEDIVIRGGRKGLMNFVGTGLSVAEHQRLTVENYVELRTMAADLRIIPVLQADTLDGYRRCRDAYERMGVDLTREPLVGLGSVCRRQGTEEIAEIVSGLAGDGLRLHGFGVKTRGLRKYASLLASADSMSWSRRGRQVRPCAHGLAQSESNCIHFAHAWRERLLEGVA